MNADDSQSQPAPSTPSVPENAVPKSTLAGIAAAMGFSADDIAKTIGAIPADERPANDTEAGVVNRLRPMGRVLRILRWVSQTDEPGKEGITIGPPDGFRLRRAKSEKHPRIGADDKE